jgi:hypothetical protein
MVHYGNEDLAGSSQFIWWKAEGRRGNFFGVLAGGKSPSLRRAPSPGMYADATPFRIFLASWVNVTAHDRLRRETKEKIRQIIQFAGFSWLEIH